MRRGLSLFVLIALAACGQRQPAAGPASAPGRAPAPSSFAVLNRDPAQCRAALERLGAKPGLMPARKGPGACGYDWAVLRSAVPGEPGWMGETPPTSCAVAAALVWWEKTVLAPAARKHLGERVTGVRHFGSYGCRTIGARSGGQLSEHAFANAIDVAGFRLASGREISVWKDWNGSPRDQAFLREVRNGACALFGTVLSPDYDAAHANHLHFDQMVRNQPFCR